MGLKRLGCNHGQEKAYRAPSTSLPASLGRAGRGETAPGGVHRPRTGPLDSGPGSLGAITDSDNSPPGKNTITFDITSVTAPYTINLQTPLPAITNPVVLNGTSQPGYAGTPIIEIDGGGMVGDGLLLAAGSDGSTIEGLDIANFLDPNFVARRGHSHPVEPQPRAVELSGHRPHRQGGRTGQPLRGVHRRRVIDGASNNTIGGAGSLGNLISGNNFDGVLIYDNPQPASTIVIGNLIGTDVSGTAPLPNTGSGIDLLASNNYDRRDLCRVPQRDLRKSMRRDQPPHGEHGPFEKPDSRELRRHRLTGRITLGNGSGGVSDNNGLNNTIEAPPRERQT